MSAALAILRNEEIPVKDSDDPPHVVSLSSPLTDTVRDFGGYHGSQDSKEGSMLLRTIENIAEQKTKSRMSLTEKNLLLERIRKQARNQTNSGIYTALVAEVSEMLSKTPCNDEIEPANRT